MNFGITAAKYTAAFENLTGETFEDSQVFKLNKEATVDVIDYLDGQDNLDDMQKALKLQDKASSEIAIFVENTAELEAIVLENEKKILDGSATSQDVVNANEALASACALFGFDKPIVCGFEDIGNDPVKALKVANEGLGDSISKGFDAVIKFFKKLFAGIWNFIKGLFGYEEKKIENLEKVNNNLKEDAKKFSNVKFTTSGQKFKNSPLAQKINGKSVVEVMQIVKADEGSDSHVTKIVESSVSLLTSIKFISEMSGKDISTIDKVAVLLSGAAKKMSELSTKEVDSLVNSISESVGQITNSLNDLKENSTPEDIVDEITKDAAGSGSVDKQIDDKLGYFLTSGRVNKDIFKEVVALGNDLYEKNKNVLVESVPILKTEAANGEEHVVYIFKTVVASFLLSNGKVKVESHMFSVKGIVSNDKVTISSEDIEKFISGLSTAEIMEITRQIDLFIAISKKFNTKMNDALNRMTKALEDAFQHIETVMKDDKRLANLDLNSYFKFVKLTSGLVSSAPAMMKAMSDNVGNIITQVKKLLESSNGLNS